MKMPTTGKRILCLLVISIFMLFSIAACGSDTADDKEDKSQADASGYITCIEDEPDTVDFQCTTIYYTVAQNVFDRLVEIDSARDGSIRILPSLAESWEVSPDGRSYTFNLRDNIKFSNGSPLTSSDVCYTFTRLLTHPGSNNSDIAECILGAVDLENGKADGLEGFKITNDSEFTITLEEPFEAFLACLSMPGASILDEETTEEAGELFGQDAEHTIGTGAYILDKWVAGKGMTLKANPDCWSSAPNNAGINMEFLKSAEEAKTLFEEGKIDVLDLDELDSSAEYFTHGDIYKDRIRDVRPVGITYIALNESVSPLDDRNVRKALQLALNRSVLLDAQYNGLGSVENGIYPRGLYGYNPDLKEIPYDKDEAASLLRESGYDGTELTISVKSSSTQGEMELVKLIASMWKEAGVNTSIKVMDESEFMDLRKKGELACYVATWTADYNDPDNFIYTFFGSKENTRFRSLCYPDESVMGRVRKARGITDPEKRISEYRELEKIIVHEDAAWIPLFSRIRQYMLSERVDGFHASWNGSVKNNYRDLFIKKSQ